MSTLSVAQDAASFATSLHMSRFSRPCTATAVLCLMVAPCLGAEAGSARFSAKVSLGVEETYDSNVFLQSTTALADRESWVTTLTPALVLNWRGDDDASASFGYAPSWTRFHAERTEDHVAQRFTASARGRVIGARGQIQASASFVDGSDESPVWTGVGGAPAVGGPALRDRRDQAVYRASGTLTLKTGAWSFRPVGTVYIADFQTAHRVAPGCQNYVDRNDLNAGFDAVRTLRDGLDWIVGYRLGMQDQARLLAYPEEYDNTYHRVLLGLDGKVAPWVTLAVTAGPEFRTYAETVHAAMTGRHRTTLFLDGSATFTLDTRNTLALGARQFEQLSMSGRGAFTDFTLEANWRHKLNESITIQTSVRGYRTEFLRPALRDDWVVSERLSVSVAITSAWSVDGIVAHEEGISRIDGMSGREYDRTAFSVSAKRIF